MTYAVTILAAACCVLGFLLVCALVGGSEQRDRLQAKVEHRDATIVGLTEMNDEKATVIRDLQRRNHPAGKALRSKPALDDDPDVRDWANVVALREALTERDAGHEGGGGA